MTILKAYKALSAHEGIEVACDAPLAPCTSYRIGGPADLLVMAHSYAALASCFQILAAEEIPWVVLGRGTNVLVADAGYRGCVIRLGGEFTHMAVDGQTICAGAAVLLPKLVNETLSRGLSGLECCAGIPGTVGGAVSMDAGSRHEWIGRAVRDVVTLKPGQGMRRYLAHEVDWGYRRSSLPPDELILEATFVLQASTKQSVADEMSRRMIRRKNTQPIGQPCCGSVFKNPGDRSVGALIDSCGLKGQRVGGAMVSERHANFVVNAGGATAADVIALMGRMHDEVAARYGIDLVPEVKLLGFEG